MSESPLTVEDLNAELRTVFESLSSVLRVMESDIDRLEKRVNALELIVHRPSDD